YLRSGRRVELNELTAPEFLEWLQAKLDQHLPGRLVPADNVLEEAYRRAIVVARVNQAIKKAIEEATEEARDASISEDLDCLVRHAMSENDPDGRDESVAWDQALYGLVARKIGFSPDED